MTVIHSPYQIYGLAKWFYAGILLNQYKIVVLPFNIVTHSNADEQPKLGIGERGSKRVSEWLLNLVSDFAS